MYPATKIFFLAGVGYKPNSVPAVSLTGVVICLTPWLPKGFSDLPAPGDGQSHMEPIRSCSGWGLPCFWCHHQNGELLPHLFTLTPQDGVYANPTGRYVFCGTFLRSPGVAVSDHPALWSSDFPPLSSLQKKEQPPLLLRPLF